ncbi:hypothetical protein [Rhodoferax sp. PAMC 29310]|uniref:hypothetical protein n=1 Tax=Rhodoferax sp. PAMC 29310 TaxID=2822760 RepID=UPI001B318EDD|nr:hypothetical protein [Rhodoferax sp. PAMC 29310]
MVFGRIFDRLRTLAGVRQVRQVPPARERPSVGSSIVRGPLRLRVKYAMDDEFWGWLASKGWRPMHLHNNRRRYQVVPEKVFIKLAGDDLAEREEIDGRLAKLSAVESDPSVAAP